LNSLLKKYELLNLFYRDILQNKINEFSENFKILEIANNKLKNEYDLLKLKYDNSETNYKNKILELEVNKKKLHEFQGNFNFYNEQSINRQTKLIKNEKEKIENMTKDIENLKSENKDLMESNMNLKEEVKKLLLIESKKLDYSNSRANRSFGHSEQTEILLKEYKEQMKVKKNPKY